MLGSLDPDRCHRKTRAYTKTFERVKRGTRLTKTTEGRTNKKNRELLRSQDVRMGGVRKNNGPCLPHLELPRGPMGLATYYGLPTWARPLRTVWKAGKLKEKRPTI